MDRARVEELLRKRIGLDPATVGASLLHRAVLNRMSFLGITRDQPEEYLELLGRSEAEVQAIIEEIVVPESWFFREEYPFLHLGRIAEAWLADASRPIFRALSLPCAAGQEPYSIAMTLLDRGLPSKRFHIDAVDVSERSLATARRGRFGPSSFRTRDLSFRDRYFEAVPEGFELKENVRETVTFRRGNILDPVLLNDEMPYHAVFCRNLLIYLDQEARGKVVALIDQLLAAGGTVFLGHAEPARILGPGFRSAGDPRDFAFVKRTAPPTASSATGSHRVEKPARVSGATIKPISRAKPPAIASVDRPELRRNEDRPDSNARNDLEKATELADAGRYDEAETLCETALKRGGPCSRAYYLLGVIRQARGDRDAAESFFNKSVYLEPGNPDALLSLALLAQRKGDSAAAANFQRRADRASEGASS